MANTRIENTVDKENGLLTVGVAKHSISRQIPIIAFVIVFAITTLISFLFYFETERLLTEQTSHELAIETSLVEPIIEQLYQQAYSDVLFLSRTPPIQGILNAANENNLPDKNIWRGRLEQILNEFLANKPYYYQIRYIGIADNGREIANVRSDNNQKIMPVHGLQEKITRPYFQATKLRAQGQVYFSRVELAKNHGRIELPFKAVLRIATPVYNPENGEFFGIIVINLDFNRFIENLKSKVLEELSFYLANQQGDFIYHPDSTKTFGFDLGKPYLMQKDFPNLVSSINNSDSTKSLDRMIIEGKSYLGHYRRLALDKFDSAHPLNLLVLKETTAIESTLNIFKIRSLLIGSCLALLTLAFAIFASRKITQPLQKITESLTDLDKRNELQNLPLASTNEIGLLARSFHNLFFQMQQAFTEQKHSALLAEQAAKKINAIFSSAAQGFITINEFGAITAFNNAAQQMFGYTEQEILGRNINELMPNNYAKKHNGYLKDYLTTGIAAIIGKGRKLTAKKKSGELFPIHLAISKVENEQGLIFTGIIRDISKETQLELEKEQQQQELLEVNERMSLATNAANIGIWQYDIPSDTLTWDDRMFVIYGYDKSDFTQRFSDWQSTVHPDDLQATSDAMTSAIENKTAFDYEFRIIQRNGTIRHLKAMALTKLNAEGEVVNVIGVNFDITQRKEIELEHIAAKELAEEATRQKAEFLASMSHEIRTPMNGILGMLGLLKRNPLSEDQLHRVNLANSSAESLLSLLNDILDFSKVEAGKLELEIIDFDLRKLLGEFAELVALKSQEKNIEIILDNRQIEQSHVKGDPGRIRQILNNLTSNAIKFTKQGEIVITAKLTKHKQKDDILLLHCTVSDTGIGIPEKKIPYLFDSFTQVDASTTRKYGGSGLGLAICKQLCKMMHGDITVVSKLEQGSTFSFTIELTKSKRAHQVLPAISIKDTQILIVDDNCTNREVLREQLEFWGAKVHEAPDGEKAIKLLENSIEVDDSNKAQSPIRVAFLDMHMPFMNGAMLAEKIKTNSNLASLKLVMMTSMAARGDASYFANLGFDAYFPKPAITSDLLKALQLCLQKNSTDEPAPFITRHYLQDLEQNSITQSSDSDIALLENCRLLLVEDNRINQEVARHILEEFGITPDIAANGLEAINALIDSSLDTAFDVILMDCQMPEMDGYQATKAIRAAKAGEHNKDISIIAMTANAMMGDKEKCLAAGMNDYLAKPIDPAKLKDKILQYLSLSADQNNTIQNSTVQNSTVQNSTVQNSKADTKPPSKPTTKLQTQTNTDESAEAPIWDQAEFAKRLNNNAAIQAKLLELFTEEMPTHLIELEKSIAASDFQLQREISHKMQGMTANISAKKLATLMKEFNQSAKDRDLEAVEGVFAQIHACYQSLCDLISETLPAK